MTQPTRGSLDPVGDEMTITRDRAMVEAVYKFRFFFVALVFAILSFAMQFPVVSASVWIKSFEALSWLLLIIAGFFAIKDCGGFAKVINEKAVIGLEQGQRQLMWGFFFVSIMLLFIVTVSVLFPSITAFGG